MNFISFSFLVFLPIVLAGYFILPNRFRWIFLLIASYYFYMSWSPVFAVLLFTSTLIFYLSSLGIDKYRENKKIKNVCFLSGLILNIGMLFVFKYYNFFQGQLDEIGFYSLVNYKLPALDFLLPMGISFYTFQGISYLIDVNRGELKAEKHLGLMMLYKAYFPLLVAGPIERGVNLIPQIRNVLMGKQENRVFFEYGRVVSGLRLVLLGFFKKIVLADNFSLIVHPVFHAPETFSATSALIATLAFTFQIFFDFSAYTDIARGVSRILGFEMIENFNRPYFASNISDFWKRWHISLSSWFRDYLYIPLGGSRVDKWRWFLNLWIVFILCGFWHGANWTFLLWGAMHGFYYFLYYVLAPMINWIKIKTPLGKHPKLCKTIAIFFTFTLVSLAWVVFRAESLQKALEIWVSIGNVPMEFYGFLSLFFEHFSARTAINVFGLKWLFYSNERISLLPIYLFIYTLIYLVYSYHARDQDDGPYFAIWPLIYRWCAYLFALFSILLFGNFGGFQFIYFQF